MASGFSLSGFRLGVRAWLPPLQFRNIIPESDADSTSPRHHAVWSNLYAAYHIYPVPPLVCWLGVTVFHMPFSDARLRTRTGLDLLCPDPADPGYLVITSVR